MTSFLDGPTNGNPQIKSPKEIQKVHDLLIKVITNDEAEDILTERSKFYLLSASQALGWVLNDPRSDFPSFLAVVGIVKE